jgi:hypothetical protein
MFKDILEVGEYPLGSYKVQYVTWTNGEWCGNGYWLRALVTNRRLLVFAENGIRSSKVEAITPADVTKVWNVCLQGRDGIMVALKDDRRLYLLVDWSQGSKLVRDINNMLATPVKPRIVPRLT